MWCQSPSSSLFSHPLTAMMIRRDNAMTSRHASWQATCNGVAWGPDTRGGREYGGRGGAGLDPNK